MAQWKWPALAAWLFGCVTVSVFAGSMTANGAGAASCPEGEYVRMIDPVVTVIDGPGDPMNEQFRWSVLRVSYLEGPLKIALGDTGFQLERVP